MKYDANKLILRNTYYVQALFQVHGMQQKTKTNEQMYQPMENLYSGRLIYNKQNKL